MLVKWIASTMLIMLPVCIEAAQNKPAQTSVGLVLSAPDAQYRLIKKHLAVEVAKKVEYIELDLIDGHYDLFNCQTPDLFTGSIERSVPVDHLESIALDELIWQHNLDLLRYPRSVWLDLLQQYEEDTLAWLQANKERHHEDLDSVLEERRLNFMKRLATRLNAFQMRNRSFPPMTIEGGCGDGGYYVKISTHPAGGRVWLISRFYFDLCKAQGLDQTNIEQCDRWEEIDLGREERLSGNYKYIVKWPDGTERMSDYSATESKEADGGDVFVIRK